MFMRSRLLILLFISSTVSAGGSGLAHVIPDFYGFFKSIGLIILPFIIIYAFFFSLLSLCKTFKFFTLKNSDIKFITFIITTACYLYGFSVYYGN